MSRYVIAENGQLYYRGVFNDMYHVWGLGKGGLYFGKQAYDKYYNSNLDFYRF